MKYRILRPISFALIFLNPQLPNPNILELNLTQSIYSKFGLLFNYYFFITIEMYQGLKPYTFVKLFFA